MLFDDEVVQQDTTDTQEQTQEDTQVQPQQVEQKVDESISKSWRDLRAKAERIERERDEAMRRVQELEAKRNNIVEEEDIRLGDDDIAEGKHLSKLNKKIKALQEEVHGYKQQSSMVATEVRLKTQYPDFDKVVTKENIESLRDMYPEIAQTLNAGSDLYATGVSAYTMIKKLGIQGEDVYQAEKAIAHRNAAKPRPIASVAPQQGDSPLSKANAFANGLTDELKEQLRREMFEARRAH